MKTFKTKHKFNSKEQYTEFCQHWAKNYKGMDRLDHFLYLAIIGKDIGAAFSPITGYGKIPSKGTHKYYSLYQTYEALVRIFINDQNVWMVKRKDEMIQSLGGIVTAEQIKELLEAIPHPKEWKENV